MQIHITQALDRIDSEDEAAAAAAAAAARDVPGEASRVVDRGAARSPLSPAQAPEVSPSKGAGGGSCSSSTGGSPAKRPKTTVEDPEEEAQLQRDYAECWSAKCAEFDDIGKEVT